MGYSDLIPRFYGLVTQGFADGQGAASTFLAIHKWSWSPFAAVPVLLISWIFGIVVTAAALDNTP